MICSTRILSLKFERIDNSNRRSPCSLCVIKLTLCSLNWTYMLITHSKYGDKTGQSHSSPTPYGLKIPLFSEFRRLISNDKSHSAVYILRQPKTALLLNSTFILISLITQMLSYLISPLVNVECEREFCLNGRCIANSGIYKGKDLLREFVDRKDKFRRATLKCTKNSLVYLLFICSMISALA